VQTSAAERLTGSNDEKKGSIDSPGEAEFRKNCLIVESPLSHLQCALHGLISVE